MRRALIAGAVLFTVAAGPHPARASAPAAERIRDFMPLVLAILRHPVNALWQSKTGSLQSGETDSSPARPVS